MGEYANYQRNRIKIGTCESMYYLRYDDRNKVQHIPGNVDAATDKGLFWRLPYPDEDTLEPGSYQPYNRGVRLYRGNDNFTDPSTVDDPGIIQLSHKCGLLVNVPCYHGERLPDCQKPTQVFWNGRSWFYELAFVKNTDDRGLMPVVHCLHCGHMWRYEWEEILPYIGDKVMLERLTDYAEKHHTKPKVAA